MLIVNCRFLTQKITGVQRYALEVSKRLKQIRPDTQFISPKDIIHTNAAKQLQVEKYGVFSGHLWEQYELPKYMNNQGKRGLLLCLANTGPLLYRNKIVTIHDIAFLRNPQWYSKAFYYYYKFLIPRISTNSKKVITDSEFSKREIIEQICLDESNIEVIYGAAPSSFKKPDSSISSEQEGKYILTVSSLAPRKNLKRIIEAFKHLKLSQYKLVIVGAGHRSLGNNGLNDLPNTIGGIIFKGHVEDEELVNLYNNAELFIFPSLYEGFGIPPLEAMSCGCPCVVSNTSSLPEICGEAAEYCDPNDVIDIADTMDKVLNDIKLKERLIEQGFEQIKKYSWQRTVDKILKLVDSLV